MTRAAGPRNRRGQAGPRFPRGPIFNSWFSGMTGRLPSRRSRIPVIPDRLSASLSGITGMAGWVSGSRSGIMVMEFRGLDTRAATPVMEN